MDTLALTGTTAQRSTMQAFKNEATKPYDDLIRPVLAKYGKTKITFYWSDFRYYRPRSGFVEATLDGQVVAIVSENGTMYVDSRTTGERAKAALTAAMDKMAGFGRDPNKPAPPIKPKDDTIVVYNPDEPAFYADEDSNLFHYEHVGVEAAEFYPTKLEAQAKGKVADGVCITS